MTDDIRHDSHTVKHFPWMRVPIEDHELLLVEGEAPVLHRSWNMIAVRAFESLILKALTALKIWNSRGMHRVQLIRKVRVSFQFLDELDRVVQSKTSSRDCVWLRIES